MSNNSPSISEKQEKSSSKKYKNPIPTVDIILRRSPRNTRTILIETRGRPPYKGSYSLPGGHMEYGETVERATLRELDEECGVRANLIDILGVYSDPKRDPRGQRISTVFVGDYAGGNPRAADDAGSVEWIDLSELLQMKKKKLSFDHAIILRDYEKWLDEKSRKETFWSTK